MGEDAHLLERALAGCAPIARALSLEDAVTQAATVASPGDTVLLSPACASFDMFSGYVERGQRFAAAVSALPGSKA